MARQWSATPSTAVRIRSIPQQTHFNSGFCIFVTNHKVIKNLTLVFIFIGNICFAQCDYTLLNIENHKFLITHIAGICPNYNKKVKKLISDEKPNILIYGHSHLLKIEFDKKNQLTAINPGAAGKHGFHKKRTMIRFKISKSGLSDMEIIELGERGKLS